MDGGWTEDARHIQLSPLTAAYIITEARVTFNWHFRDIYNIWRDSTGADTKGSEMYISDMTGSSEQNVPLVHQ